MIATLETAAEPRKAVGAPASAASWLDAALLAGILGVMLWGIGDYGLYEPHEGHFAGVGREMVTSHDWITPHLNGAPYLNKPPLFYWLIALSYTILGVQNEFAARLPLVLIGWSGVVLAWSWARKLWGIRAGRIAAAMLAVNVGWYLFCHQLLIDALLSVLNLSALYLLWKAIGNRYSRLAWVWFYISVGLAVLAKGLIGMAFPAAALLIFIAWRRDWKLTLDAHPLMGVIIIAGVVGPWVWVLESRNPGTLWYMLASEHFQRMIDERWPPDYSVVKVNWWKYLGVTAVWLMPWSLLLPQVFRFCRTSPLPPPEQSAERARADAVLLLAIAALLPVVVFLPMPSRLIYYSLPCALPFVVLAAGWWSAACEPERVRQRWSAGITFLLFGLAVVVAAFFLPRWLQAIPDIATSKGMLKTIPAVAFIIGGGLMLGGILLKFQKPAASIAVLGIVLGAADAYNVHGFAEFDAVLSSKRMVNNLRDKAGADCIWVSEGSKEIGASAGIAFYLGRDAEGQSRFVLIMSDDKRRPPPRFPGPPLNYLIDHKQLEQLWASGKPVLFVTDFQRTDWLADYAHLPSNIKGCVATAEFGNRRVYANAAAWERLSAGANTQRMDPHDTAAATSQR